TSRRARPPRGTGPPRRRPRGTTTARRGPPSRSASSSSRRWPPPRPGSSSPAATPARALATDGPRGPVATRTLQPGQGRLHRGGANEAYQARSLCLLTSKRPVVQPSLGHGAGTGEHAGPCRLLACPGGELIAEGPDSVGETAWERECPRLPVFLRSPKARRRWPSRLSLACVCHTEEVTDSIPAAQADQRPVLHRRHRSFVVLSPARSDRPVSTSRPLH